MAGAVEQAPAPRRILFATVDGSWAGAQAQMLELASGLDRAEFEPVLLTTEHGRGELAARSRALGIRTHTLPYRCLRRVFPFVGYYAVAPLLLGRLLRAERIALVHTHDPHAALPILRAPGARALPLVSHIHDLDQRWLTRRTLALLARPNAVVVAISDACARYARQQGAP
ncbi:MAG TPA: glycosyltransferase, partial [Gemmatimonadaceae bacterium]|nr:glycosyltransferase [Gemmatimonadaceae bacterium]